MIVLRIDGVELPVNATGLEFPAYDVRHLRSCQGQREGEAIMLGVKATAAATKLFGFAEQAYTSEHFNDSYHYGEVLVDGVVLFAGVVSYLSTYRRNGSRIYNIKIASGGAKWADRAATTKLKDAPIDASRRLDLASISQSWTDDNPIRMLPVNRDSYPEAANSGLYEVYHPKVTSDYHPFISVKALINSLLSDNEGYTIESKFLSSEFFEKLVMSGAYKSMKADMAYATMGFNAVRSTSSSATADGLGRVNVTMPVLGRNIGAFVDTVSPTTVDENGKMCESAYSNGGCFTFEEGTPVFTPKRDVDIAFDLHFCYTTDFKITSSKWLKGFTNIYVGNDCRVEVDLPNPYIDRRRSITTNMSYKLFIFDYDATASYRLTEIGDVSGKVSSVSFKTKPIFAVKLYKRDAGAAAFTEYTGDWALYDGHVEECGAQRVEFTLRTPYERCTPSSPKHFNNIFFMGAEQGQVLTLHPGCSITPHFGGTVGYGQRITFQDVANYDVAMSDVVDAVAHMFNLCIYTHHPSKRIYIEPYDDFFSGDIVDWRALQRDDSAQYEECVTESFMVTQLGYQPADGAVGYCYSDADGEFGSWRHIVESYATKQSVDSRQNILFHPTASTPTLVGTAPSATVLVVGDRESVELQEYIEPRIVLYHGVKPLPVDEYWPTPAHRDSYPLAEFHSIEEGETLCFEDRDGIIGLHRYYDNELKEQLLLQRLTTDIYLTPEQYVTLLDPNTEGANIRSRFRLNVEGSSALFRLDAIESYDSKRYIARCRFQRLYEE